MIIVADSFQTIGKIYWYFYFTVNIQFFFYFQTLIRLIFRQLGSYRLLPTAWKLSATSDSLEAIDYFRQLGSYRLLPTAWKLSTTSDSLEAVGYLSLPIIVRCEREPISNILTNAASSA